MANTKNGDKMDIIYVIGLSLFSAAILFLLTKLMGNKQVSQMTIFDYVTGITIGSIAAEMATDLEEGFHRPLTAMIIYGVIAVLLSVLTNKSIKARRLFDGTSLILFDNGKLFKRNLSKAKLNVSEFLTQCRIMGYPNLSDIQTVIFEPNGRISILPKSDARPLIGKDFNMKQKNEKMPVTIILDGEVLKNNLKFTGNNDVWLKKQLDNQGVKNIKDVIYASCDADNKLNIYTSVKDMPDRDIFS